MVEKYKQMIDNAHDQAEPNPVRAVRFNDQITLVMPILLGIFMNRFLLHAFRNFFFSRWGISRIIATTGDSEHQLKPEWHVLPQ